MRIVQYGLYPMLLTIVLTVTYLAISNHWNFAPVYAGTTAFLVLTLIFFERHFSFKLEWAMTKKSFLRDVKYIAIDLPVIIMTKTGFGVWALYYSQHHSPFLHDTALWVEIVAFLLAFEFLQYWYHRISHRASGKLGDFLWKIHVAHHLPNRVYVVMHAVFNPINAFINTCCIQAPLILLGVSPEATLVATLLIDLQSLISHFNVDLRAGVLNYIFIGTETHRYHHSADSKAGINFGNTLAIWDILFGTFYYRPGEAPKSLGVTHEERYPDSRNLWRVISLPFMRNKSAPMEI